MKKETAVEWIEDIINKSFTDKAMTEVLSLIFNKAKEMEKEQIIKAYDDGYDLRDDMGSLSYNPKGKDYYQQTYTNQ